MAEEFFYRKLSVYQKAMDLVVDIYKLLKKFPLEERYALCDQIRRASISVPSNIAEGMGRFSDKEKIHFLEISNGSLMETMCQLEIAKQLGYLSQEDYQRVEADITEIACMLSSLRKKITQATSPPR
ncbi:MAG: four helix bundle protein [Bacteroides sp.]|nr:four helix bundle protein [Bacteroides sp.]